MSGFAALVGGLGPLITGGMLALVALAIGVTVFGLARQRHVRQLLAEVEQPRPIPASVKQRLREERVEVAALAGLSLAHAVWLCSQIDPRVLDGADFASSDDIRSPLDFVLWFARETREKNPAALEGFVNRLRGYVGEQYAAEALESAGHEVEFPDSPTQPGWDLEIDGHDHVNVKMNPDLAAEYVRNHPDGRAVVPEEYADHVQHMEGIDAVPGFSGEEVDAAVAASEHAATHMVDLWHDIPLLTVCFAALSEGRAVLRGKPVARAGRDAGARIALSAGGAYAGGIMGATVGSLLGPIGTMAGGLLGAIAGRLGGRKVAEQIKTRRLRHLQSQFQQLILEAGKLYRAHRGSILAYMRAKIVAPPEGVWQKLRQSFARRHSGFWKWLWPDKARVLAQAVVARQAREVQAALRRFAMISGRLGELARTEQYAVIGEWLWENRWLTVTPYCPPFARCMAEAERVWEELRCEWKNVYGGKLKGDS